jgi:peptide/nickel transport system ATP-binding protein/oligopeptide transport system ATP-binding protein
MKMTDVLLSIRNLKTYFYTEDGVVEALDGVNLDIMRGETLGLVGETGCGKSVTALSVMKLIPDPPGKIIEGKIIFEGENLLDKTQKEMSLIRGSGISMIFQDPMTSLNPVYTIGNQVGEVIQLHQHTRKAETWKRVVDALRLVKIADAEERATSYPHQFSGGMRQRAMIAMMLSCRPAILIADEPTTSLDVTIQAQVLRIMEELQRELNMTILLITHNLGVVAETCNRVAVMYSGNVVELADVETLFEAPRHPYTQGLLDSIPRPDQDLEDLAIIPGSVPSLINPLPGCRFYPRCSYAEEICSQEKPKEFMINNGHMVACHLYGKDN